jgi:hypothetical protein
LTNGENYLSSASKAPKVKDSIKVSNGHHPFYLLKAGIVTEKTVSDKDVLNEGEVGHLIQPTRFKQNSQKNALFKNGPSFIPIHNNTAEDKGLAMFIK